MLSLMTSATSCAAFFGALAVLALPGCGDGGGDAAPAEAADGGALDGNAEAAEPLPDPVPDDCITEVDAGKHEFHCDGLTFGVNVPDQCLERACGVVLDVHGWFMTGADEEREAHLAERGADHDLIVIQPTANLGPPMGPFPEGPSWSFDHDEPLVHAFLMRAIDVWHANEKRIHVTGFSQGGAMTWRFLCHHSQMLASVAPGAASSFFGTPETGGVCEGSTMPAERIPVLYLHGTRDALVAFSGAQTTRDILIAQWGLKKDKTVSTDTEHSWTRYGNDQGDVFEFIQHDYATDFSFLTGHCFPGSDSKGVLACKGKNAFVWGEAVMDFFVAHPRP